MSPLETFAQSPSSLVFALAEIVGCAWMLRLQDATACTGLGWLASPAGVLGPLGTGVTAVEVCAVVGVEAVREGVEVVPEGTGLVVVGVEAVWLLGVELLLPQPAMNAPPASVTTSHVDSLRIIYPSIVGKDVRPPTLERFGDRLLVTRYTGRPGPGAGGEHALQRDMSLKL